MHNGGVLAGQEPAQQPAEEPTQPVQSVEPVTPEKAAKPKKSSKPSKQGGQLSWSVWARQHNDLWVVLATLAVAIVAYFWIELVGDMGAPDIHHGGEYDDGY